MQTALRRLVAAVGHDRKPCQLRSGGKAPARAGAVQTLARLKAPLTIRRPADSGIGASVQKVTSEFPGKEKKPRQTPGLERMIQQD